MINELLANPVGSDLGQEYLELVNQGTGVIALRDWTIEDLQGVRHVFESQVLQPGEVVVIFDRGEHDQIDGAILSSSGTLSLNNGGDTITVRNIDGEVMARPVYPGVDEGVAMNRADESDPEGPLVNHDTIAMTPLSPGRRADGDFWVDPPPLLKLVINEILPNPVGADADAEYVEIVNVGEAEVNLAGYSLGDAVSDDRQVFGGGETIAVGEAIVIYDGGEHPDVPGARIASSGGLSLNNTGDAVNLFRPDGSLMDGFVYAESSEGVALNRAIDGDPFTSMVPHDGIDGAAGPMSPGLKVDGTPWE